MRAFLADGPGLTASGPVSVAFGSQAGTLQPSANPAATTTMRQKHFQRCSYQAIDLLSRFVPMLPPAGAIHVSDVAPGEVVWSVRWDDVLTFELRWSREMHYPDRVVVHRKGTPGWQASLGSAASGRGLLRISCSCLHAGPRVEMTVGLLSLRFPYSRTSWHGCNAKCCSSDVPFMHMRCRRRRAWPMRSGALRTRPRLPRSSWRHKR